MAKLMPSLPSCVARMTPGERRLAERLLQKLEDDYLCWYNVPIGEKQFYPDFILFNPHRGILVLEVKDWKLNTIQGADRYQVTLLTSNGLTKTANPLEQARMNSLRVETLLRSDPALRNLPNHAYTGKLIMPYGWGAVLTNITRKQFESEGLGQVIEPGRVICQDEMLESVDPEAFQSRLWQMFATAFPCKLTLPQIERVRWHLFPELRLSSKEGQFGLFGAAAGKQAIEIPDLIKVMDTNQEQLARSMGEGHRVIHGVAGSGKSMILGFRCLHLARATFKPILVLCYNVTLAARLKQLLAERGAGERVTAETSTASLTTNYIYNASGQRVAKTGNGGSYNYIYSPKGALLSETTQNGTSIGSDYIWLNGQPIGLIRNGSLYYVHDDHLGRPDTITNASGSVVWKAANAAFDSSVLSTSIGSFNLAFPGQYYDSESTLYYNGARYYNSLLGAYMQSDPIGLAGGLTTYAYVSGNPVMTTDPRGTGGPIYGIPGIPNGFDPSYGSALSGQQLAGVGSGSIASAPNSLSDNMGLGAGIFGIGGFGLGVVVTANLIGFPEVEVIETGGTAAGSLAAMLIAMSEPMGSLAAGGLNGSMLLAPFGLAAGAAATSPNAPTYSPVPQSNAPLACH